MSAPAGDARGAPVAGSAVGAWALLLAVGVAIFLVVPGSEWFQISFLPAAYADSDYELHWAASQALVHGSDPYDPAVVASYGAATGRPFTPFCAAHPLMVRLFALTGGADVAHFQDGYRVTRTINIALLLLSVLLLASALRQAGRRMAATGPGAAPGNSAGAGANGLRVAAALAVAAALLAFNDSTWMALHYNQLNFLALAAVCGALVAAQRGRPGAEGALLALAALAKTSPALLIVVAAMAGRWRTVLAAALTLVALGVLSVAWNGWAVHASWLAMAGRELGYAAELRPGFFNNSHHVWNLSPNGTLSRAGDAAGWSAGAVRAAAWGVTAVVLAALWVAVRRTSAADPGTRTAQVAHGAAAAAHGGAGAAAAFARGAAGAAAGTASDASRGVFAQYALGVGATFLVSSVTWSPHLSLAALPAAWLVHSAWSGAARRAPALLLLGGVACALLCLPLGTFGTPQDQGRDIQLKLAACVLLFAATWVLATDDCNSRATE